MAIGMENTRNKRENIRNFLLPKSIFRKMGMMRGFQKVTLSNTVVTLQLGYVFLQPQMAHATGGKAPPPYVVKENSVGFAC
jgi:hypothetical protein